MGKENTFVSSSSWPALKSLKFKIWDDYFWLFGIDSKVQFWNGNWLREPLTDLMDL